MIDVDLLFASTSFASVRIRGEGDKHFIGFFDADVHCDCQFDVGRFLVNDFFHFSLYLFRFEFLLVEIRFLKIASQFLQIC